MIALTTLPRLLWRPATLYNAAVLAILAILGGWAVYVLRGGAMELANASTEQVLLSAELKLALGAWLLPNVAGGIVAWALYEFLLCSHASVLPGLRRRLLPGLLLSAALAALATAAWSDAQPGAQLPPAFCALGFFSFASAVHGLDPLLRARKLPFRLLALSHVGVLFLLPELVRAFEAQPLALGPAALALGSLLLALPLRRSAIRERVLDPHCAVDAAYREPDARHEYAQGNTLHARARAPWAPASALASTRDWVRASLHETHGWVRGGWLGACLGTSALYSLVLFTIALLLEKAAQPDWPTALGAGYASAFLGGTPSAAAVPAWIGMWIVATPLLLGRAQHVPLARAQRGEVVARVALAHVLGLVAGFAASAAVLGALLFVCGVPLEAPRGLPHSLRVLLCIAIAAPLPQWLRLRFLDGRSSAPGPVLTGGLAAASVVPLMLPGLLLGQVGGPELARTPAWVQLALAGVLFVAAQAVWRRVLVAHFRTRDLV